MKINSVILTFIAACLLVISSYSLAKEKKDALWKINSYERKVNSVGQRILRENEIGEMIAFRVPPRTTAKSKVNAYASEFQGIITVERPLLRIIENDDELAAVLSHEIVHILNRHQTKYTAKSIFINTIIISPCVVADVAMACVGVPYPFFTHFGKFLTGGFNSNINQKYELDADNKAIDLMVKAGYNPIYMESIFQRIMSDGTYLEFFRTHPKGSIRIENIHRKIATEYPEFLEQKKEKVQNEEDEENEKNTLPINNKVKSQKTFPEQEKAE